MPSEPLRFKGCVEEWGQNPPSMYVTSLENWHLEIAITNKGLAGVYKRGRGCASTSSSFIEVCYEFIN